MAEEAHKLQYHWLHATRCDETIAIAMDNNPQTLKILHTFYISKGFWILCFPFILFPASAMWNFAISALGSFSSFSDFYSYLTAAVNIWQATSLVRRYDQYLLPTHNLKSCMAQDISHLMCTFYYILQTIVYQLGPLWVLWTAIEISLDHSKRYWLDCLWRILIFMLTVDIYFDWGCRSEYKMCWSATLWLCSQVSSLVLPITLWNGIICSFCVQY